MTIPAGVPMGFVFAMIFLCITLFIACVALSFFMKETPVRVGLAACALVLLAIMGGGAYLTMTAEEEAEPPPEDEAAPQVVAVTAPEEEAPKMGKVELVVDESTISKDVDALSPEPLDLETTTAKGAQQERAERRRVSERLVAIENELKGRLASLSSQVQTVNRRLDAKEIDNFDALFWQAKFQARQYGLVVRAMDEKEKVVSAAVHIPEADKANDMGRIQARREMALKKWQEYQGVLTELSKNAQTLHRI